MAKECHKTKKKETKPEAFLVEYRVKAIFVLRKVRFKYVLGARALARDVSSWAPLH